jgi:hypothetical protein
MAAEVGADHRVSPEGLYRRSDPNQLGFETTVDVPSLDGIAGQERALNALEFGLGIEGDEKATAAAEERRET